MSIRLTLIFILLIDFSFISTQCLYADGGKVQFSQVEESQRITLFTAPTPLSTGVIDFSILIQDVETGAVSQNHDVIVRLESDSSHQVLTKRATHAQSTNKLLQSAKIDVVTPGKWHVSVQTTDQISKSLQCDITVQDNQDKMKTVFIFLGVPVCGICLFILREFALNASSHDDRKTNRN